MNKNTIILLLAICIYLVALSFQLYRAVKACDGKFVYPLDDPYIHLTMARNLANHGSWGLNPGEFASASSSIFYTLFLGCIIFITGASEYLPLIINTMASIGVLISVYYLLREYEIDLAIIGIVLLASIFLIPLISLTISGMEHTIQILVNTWYFYFCLKYLSKKEYTWDRDLLWLCVFSSLVVMARFEGLFFVTIPFIYFFFSRQFVKALAVLFSALLPVLVFGTISVIHGSYFLPNSLMIKAERPDQFGFAELLVYSIAWAKKLYPNNHLLALFIVLSGCFIILNVVHRKYKSIAYIACFSCIVWMIVHLQFARTGWFYRYEAYLMSLSFITLAILYRESNVFLPRYRMYLFIVVCVMMIPVARRGSWSLKDTPVAMRNIHDQQYQMAQFIKSYYPTGTIAANDIGAITFFNTIHLVDLYGLGSIEVLRLKEKGLLNSSAYEELASRKGVQLAIIYDSWFEGRIPATWKRVEKWTISNNVICAFSDVSFYAVDPGLADSLKQNLKAFHSQLPQRTRIE